MNPNKETEWKATWKDNEIRFIQIYRILYARPFSTYGWKKKKKNEMSFRSDFAKLSFEFDEDLEEFRGILGLEFEIMNKNFTERYNNSHLTCSMHCLIMLFNLFIKYFKFFIFPKWLTYCFQLKWHTNGILSSEFRFALLLL